MQPVQIPEQLSTHLELRTRWSDEDNQGVLNNAVYLSLFEEGRHRYMTDLGFMEHNRFPYLLLQTNVRFVRPGRGAAQVQLELGTMHLGRTSFVQAYRVRSAQGEIWCEAEAVMVFYDPETMESIPMPESFRSAVQRLEGWPSDG